ncbi:MAG: helix-turn-helix domain-containing protein [bacterium]|nr:helix-turn-helix domain-containing protein [bacterium]
MGIDASTDAPAVIQRLGRHVRRRRGELGLTAQELAERAGLSRRFVAQVEAGKGNIAIGRLEGLAAALEVRIEALIAEPRAGGVRQAIDRLLAGRSDEDLRWALNLLELALGEQAPRAVALLGIRGAGKSTVGPRLAEALELPFVELDEHIETAAGLSLVDIFAIHGEPYYRRLEARCVARLLAAREACVLALPGGIVGNEDAFELVRQSCFCAWLKARPEDHMARVLAQGDRRPMAGSTDAMVQLRALIASREPLYRRADVVVDTSTSTVREVVAQLVRAVERIRLEAGKGRSAQ